MSGPLSDPLRLEMPRDALAMRAETGRVLSVVRSIRSGEYEVIGDCDVQGIVDGECDVADGAAVKMNGLLHTIGKTSSCYEFDGYSMVSRALLLQNRSIEVQSSGYHLRGSR